MSGKPQRHGWDLVFGAEGKAFRLSTTDTARFVTDDEALCDVIRGAYGGSTPHRQVMAVIAEHGVPEQKERIEALRAGMYEYRQEESRKFRKDGVSDQVRAMLADGSLPRPELDAAWLRIQGAIETRALSRPKKDRQPGYEVHHEVEVARECFFIGLTEGKGIKEAEAHVRLRMSIDSDPERLIREWREAAAPEPESEGMQP